MILRKVGGHLNKKKPIRFTLNIYIYILDIFLSYKLVISKEKSYTLALKFECVRIYLIELFFL